MKPIEPGCLAIIKTGALAGTPVNVIDRAPKPRGNMMPNGITTVGGLGKWICDVSKPMRATYDDGSSRYVRMGVIHERHLLRIDNYQPETTETEQEVTV